MNRNLLQKVGLTEGESAVYLALLELGSSTVGPVVKKSGVAYSNVYDVLDRLILKGLASFIVKAKTKYFQAVQPSRLYDYLDKKEKEIESQKELLGKLVPDLEKVQQLVSSRQEAEVFVGWKGVTSAFERFYNVSKLKEYCFLYVYNEEYCEEVDAFFKKVNKLAADMGITFRGISMEDYRKSVFIKNSKLINMRYVDFPIPANVEILDDQVLITAWSKDNPVCFWIKSNEMAKNFKDYFESLWAKAKE